MLYLGGSLVLFFLFIGTPFASAFFARYVLNNAPSLPVQLNLAVLESTTTPLSVSLDQAYSPMFEWAEGGAVYKIHRLHFCNEYDENDNCIDQVYNLCPYITIEPNSLTGTTEGTEVGYSLNA